ncbi:MAG: 50S ribosomal protein L27 [bacterium]|nr:50S ribosomal protein L27 [bacterium]
MAKTKSGGSSRLGRSSRPKYLGIKVNNNQSVRPGMVIVRQRGTSFKAGENVKRGGDDTLYAHKAGVVKFVSKKVTKFDGSRKLIKVVSVVDQKK